MDTEGPTDTHKHPGTTWLLPKMYNTFKTTSGICPLSMPSPQSPMPATSTIPTQRKVCVQQPAGEAGQGKRLRKGIYHVVQHSPAPRGTDLSQTNFPGWLGPRALTSSHQNSQLLRVAHLLGHLPMMG